MKIHFTREDQMWSADLAAPLDISIPLYEGPDAVNCFWAPPVDYSPVKAGDFTGDTRQGGVVNFYNIKVNPHGNGTHTECVGHITEARIVLGECLTRHHFFARLVTLYPMRQDDGDRVIVAEQLREVLQPGEAEALVLRTMPNTESKLRQHYSGTNPPYLHPEAVEYLVDCGIQHLLIDLPSVDREEDGGKLLSHKAFWQYPDATRKHCTITELVYVPNEIPDAWYLLNIQTAAFQLDASPSRPVLFAVQEIYQD